MQFRFFKRDRANGGWMAVWLGESSARFAHVVPGARPKVLALEERQWDKDEPKALERIAKQVGAARERCTTVLAQADYQMLLVEAPNVKREELKAALRWRIKDMIDYHVDDATLDVLDVPGVAGQQRAAGMYVVVAKNDAVRAVIARFEAARMALSVIDVPDTVQRNIAALYESPGRALLAVSFDAESGLITVTSGGELYVSRRLDMAQSQLSAEPAARERAFDRVLVEVQRSLDHFERNFSHVSIERVLVAPMQDPESLAAHIGASVGLPVSAMNLGDVMDLPPAYEAAPPETRTAWFRLIGAGLRVEPTAL